MCCYCYRSVCPWLLLQLRREPVRQPRAQGAAHGPGEEALEPVDLVQLALTGAR